MNKLDEILSKLEERLKLLETGLSCYVNDTDTYSEMVGRVDELKEVIYMVEDIILKD